MSGQGLSLRRLSVVFVSGIFLSGCLATFAGDRVGSRLGGHIGDLAPVGRRVDPKPGGNFCQTLSALGWKKTDLSDIDGNIDALRTIGATAQTFDEGCP